MSNPGRTASGGDAEAMPPDREAGVVLMADRSTSAPDMARALREDGFGVLTCDAIALPERAARLDPEAIIVDLADDLIFGPDNAPSASTRAGATRELATAHA